MVAINKLYFAGALAATVSAAPLAAPQPNALSLADTHALLIRELVAANVIERDVLPSLTTLVGEASSFISSTLTNLLNLDISSESDAVATLLVNLNEFILNLETDLKSYKVTNDIGSLAQKILIQSGIQSFVLGLTTLVIDLEAKILKSGGTPSAAVQAQITALQANITTLKASLSSSGLLGVVGSLLSKVESVLDSIVSSL